MGVLGHNDLFSRKFLTAIVRDSHDRGYFIHIKKTLDDYFITKLNGTFYAFSMEGARIITHRWFGVRSFRWIDYDTTHYKSIQFDKLEELKLFLIKNRLPRMNMLQYYMIKLLGRKERKKELTQLHLAKTAIESQELQGKEPQEIDVPPHDIEALIQELTDRQTDFPEESANLINYIKSLDIDTIVTPCQKISEYIEDDLVSTKPSFLGELMPRIMRLLGKHGEITNSPYSAKNAWFLKIFIFLFIGVGVASVFWMIDQGFFDQILNMFPDFSSASTGLSALNPSAAPSAASNQCSDAALQARYTPEQLKIAVDSGTETCKLSPTMQSLVDGVEVPKANPKP